MNQLTFRLGQKTKKITIMKANSATDISKLIQSVFRLRQKLIGVTDEYGKFYDLQFVSDNLRILSSHILNLVLARDATEQNLSFASQNMEMIPKKKEQFTENTELPMPIERGYIGCIADLGVFEELFLEQGKLTVVVCCDFDHSQLKIPYRYYIYESDKNSVIIYFGRKKVGQLFMDDWDLVNKKLQGIIQNLNLVETPKAQSKDLKIYDQDIDSPFQKESDEEMMAIQEIKTTFMENLTKLRQQQTISELQFFKLKAKLFENPQQFMRKYQMGTRQGFRKKRSIDELRRQIVRSKQQKVRYQTIINQFKEAKNPQKGQHLKNEIPIIVRKYNNVIQKINSSYPLTLQQEQALNLIMELQLKGLISENDGRVYKSHILQEDPQIFSLFMEYFEDIIDQIELTQKLKNINKNKKQDENNKSEELVRLVIKYSKRNSFELLRNLALQGNHYVMKCFDRYQKDHNGHILSTSLEKVANYYRAKNRLEERLDDEEF